MPMIEKSAAVDTDHEADTAYGHWFRWAARYREPLTADQQADLDARITATLELPPPEEAPVITALVPNQATLGSPSFTLSVQGEHFTAQSVIVWNGADEATTYVSPDRADDRREYGHGGGPGDGERRGPHRRPAVQPDAVHLRGGGGGDGLPSALSAASAPAPVPGCAPTPPRGIMSADRRGHDELRA